MKILILGGDGFIGSHLVDQIVELGHEVTVFGRFPYQASRNLEHQRARIKLVSGEFANKDTLLHALENQDVIYHFISSTNPATSWQDPHIEVEQNLKDSIQLFELALQSGVKKIVFPSSGGTIYGHQDHAIDENTPPRPFSPYGIVKLTTEFFLDYFKKRAGLQFDIYRIGNAYGPRQPITRNQGVIATWMHAILTKQPVHVYGGHETLRDYIFVKDAVALMTHSLTDLNQSETFNIGSGHGVSVLDLLEIFKKSIKEPFEYHLEPKRAFDNSYVVLDSSKILRHFPGFKISRLEDRLIETWDSCKATYLKNRR